jgi:hypothetical protein
VLVAVVPVGRVHRLGAAARQVVDGRVVGDLQQPRPERRVAAEPAEPVEGAQERVLADVVGAVAPDDAGGDPEHHVAVALDERLEGAEVAAQRSPHEDGILVGAGRRPRGLDGHVTRVPAAPSASNPYFTGV